MDRVRACCVGHGALVRAPGAVRTTRNVRWSPEVDDRQRATLEAQFHLTQGEFREGRTWSYRIADTTSTNLETLVAQPSVEDTYGIDRNSYTVEGAPGRFDGLGFALLFGFGTSTLASSA